MRAFAPAIVLALLLGAPAPARAADDPVTRKKVQSYLDLAASLFKDGDFAGALTELRRAESLSPLAVVEFNIARCLDELHRDVDAYAAYDRYVALNDTTAGAPERQKRAADAMARLMASMMGSLEITCPVEGSSVLVLGLLQIPEQCPWKTARIRAGTYEVQTFSPGFPTLVSHVVVQGGRTTSLVAQPAPGKASAPASPAPASDVPRAASAPQPAPAQPAPASATQPVVGVQTTGNYQSGFSSSKIIGGSVLSAFAVAGFAVMGFFIYDRDQHLQNIRNGHLTDAAAISAEGDSADHDRLYAAVCGTGAGALLIPAVILFATSGETTEPGLRTAPSVTVAPTVLPSGVGVVFSGALP